MFADYLILGVIPEGGTPTPTPTPTSAPTPAWRTLLVGPGGFVPARGGSGFQPGPDGIPVIDQAPLTDAKLDYRQDWSGWLSPAEDVVSAVWHVGAGITVSARENDDLSATIWLTGGAPGGLYLCSCTVTTDKGRIDTRSFRVRIASR